MKVDVSLFSQNYINNKYYKTAAAEAHNERMVKALGTNDNVFDREYVNYFFYLPLYSFRQAVISQVNISRYLQLMMPSSVKGMVIIRNKLKLMLKGKQMFSRDVPYFDRLDLFLKE